MCQYITSIGGTCKVLLHMQSISTSLLTKKLVYFLNASLILKSILSNSSQHTHTQIEVFSPSIILYTKHCIILLYITKTKVKYRNVCIHKGKRESAK